MSVVPSNHGSHRGAFNSKPNTHQHSHTLNSSFRTASASPRPVLRNTINPSVQAVVPSSGNTTSTNTTAAATTTHPSKPARQSHKSTPVKGTTATTVVAASQIPGLLTLSKPLEDKFASRPAPKKNHSHKHQNFAQRTTGTDNSAVDPSIKVASDKDVPSKSPRRSRHKRTKPDGNPPGPTVDVPHASIPGVTEPVHKRRPKASSNQRSASRISAGRARVRPMKEESEEDESEEWEMPLEKRGTDVLTWQQTSPPSAPTKPTPKMPSPRAQVNRLQTRSISPSPAVSISTPPSATNLTWQQALFESSAPVVVSKKKNPTANLQRRSSFESSLSSSAPPAQFAGPTSSTATRPAKGNTFPRAHHLTQNNQRASSGHAKSISLSTLGLAGGSIESGADNSAKGPLYAGSVFQNSPLAGDLPKPRFGLKI
ncbi:hypothetical protein [Phaffia rhodozyma]|uniref:Uncharacterized protein n=1 Tax=Phaffia rhodozyma TaxID=264483 RepID=A0A0F7SEY6_PHARH|nr:hypothetical protein [Phaffia rhodozyma]